MGQDKGGPPSPTHKADPPVGLEAPIDESLVVLVVAGVFLGVFFFLKSQNKQEG